MPTLTPEVLVGAEHQPIGVVGEGVGLLVGLVVGVGDLGLRRILGLGRLGLGLGGVFLDFGGFLLSSAAAFSRGRLVDVGDGDDLVDGVDDLVPSRPITATISAQRLRPLLPLKLSMPRPTSRAPGCR